ncbi:MAG: hypothetical protein ACYSSI_13255 [Planctomycetota bacterium]|jgi:hypothetical protein
MDNFWVKIGVFAVVVVGLVIAVKVFFPSGKNKVEQVEFEQTEKEPQAVKTTKVLEDEPVSGRPPRRKMIERSEDPTAPQPKPKPEARLNPEEKLQADKLLQAVRLQYSLARRSPVSFKKMVDFCRELFKQFPDSQQAEEARELLRRMPKKYRDLYKVTSEELGLTE